MRAFLMRVTLALLSSIVVLRGSAFAGNNAGGTALLSWDRAGVDSILHATPIAPFALFLHVRDAPDVRALAVKVTWTTNTADRPPCYAIVSSPPPELTVHPDSLFGWALDEPPGVDFRGDSSYWQSIRFPEGSPKRDCVRYLVSSAGCDAPTFAMFEAAIVVVEDALGRVDTLVATSGARIVPAPLPPLVVDDVYPRELPTRERTGIELRGDGFEAGTRVYLGRGGQLIQADEVVVLDSTTVRAEVTPWFGAGSALDVIVDHPLKPELVVASGVMEVVSAQAGYQARPSNEGLPFRQIDPMDSTRVEGTNTPVAHDVAQAWGLSEGLTFARRANGDTAALIHSHPNHGVGLSYWSGWPAWVRYTIAPPMYATSLGTLLQGGHIYDGAGSFADAGKRLATATLTLEGGIPGPVIEYRVGTHVRNWTAGGVHFPPAPYDSVNFWPYFTTRPTDTLVCELLPGAGSTHYDCQEVRLPGAYRNRKIESVTFQSTSDLYRNSPWWAGSYHGTSGLFGAALWPSFEIQNRHELSLGLQMQTDTSYNTRAYGGYVLRDTLFGASKTINANGCMLSCMAMANTFFGDSVTVPVLNDYLVRHVGYARAEAAEIDSVLGQEVGATVQWHAIGGRKIRAGDSLLIELSPRNPLLTLRASSPNAGTIVRRHRSGQIASGTLAVVYSGLDPKKASSGFGTDAGHPWVLTNLGNHSLTPGLVEASLVDSLPVLLDEPDHYILARGWGPSYGTASAAGTYLIRDPGHKGVVRLNQIFNTGGGPKSYANTYRKARRCTPADGTRFATQSSARASAHVGQATADLTFVLQGGGRISIVNPNDQIVYYDDSQGYLGTIPDVDGWADFGGGLDDDPGYADPGVDIVRIPGAVGGDYRIVVSNAADSSIVLGVTALDGNGLGGADATLYAVPNSGGAAFLAHVVGGELPSVQIDTLGTTEVQRGAGRSGTTLRVSPNPSRGQVLMGMELRTGGRVVIEVYDLGGRLVATPVAARFEPGRHEVSWNAGIPSFHAGVFFVRMKAPDATVTRRIVFLP